MPAPNASDRRVDTPVDVMRMRDKHIIPHPDVVISAPACRRVKWGGGIEPGRERPEGQDAALDQERLQEIEVGQGISGADVSLDFVAMNARSGHVMTTWRAHLALLGDRKL